MVKFVLFSAATIGIVLLSRRSLLSPGSHGFYRFFAFELIAILILLNVEVWFEDLLTVRQLIASLFLCLSLWLVIDVFYLLKKVGKPLGRTENSANLEFENTQFLVKVGVYRYIRHPAYASLLLLGWGTFLKRPSLLGGLLSVAMSLFLVATAKVEETENMQRFGKTYVEYMKSTKMFIPFLL